MGKQIRTNFDSPKDAKEAKQYLEDSGYENVEMNLSQVMVETDDENWIGAYEIANSHGASFEEGSAFPPEFEKHYHISEDQGEVLEDDEEIDMIDPNAYIDMNLGFGDFEIMEPYVLHTYQKVIDGEEA